MTLGPASETEKLNSSTPQTLIEIHSGNPTSLTNESHKMDDIKNNNGNESFGVLGREMGVQLCEDKEKKFCKDIHKVLGDKLKRFCQEKELYEICNKSCGICERNNSARHNAIKRIGDYTTTSGTKIRNYILV